MSNHHISSHLFESYSIHKTSKPSSRNKLRTDPDAINAASKDYGNLIQEKPCAVLCPSSVHDIVDLIKLSNSCPTPFPISARGRGHSVRGQAAARGGVVVDMASLGGGIRFSWSPSEGYYADVGGEQMWIDVLRAGLEHGLAPVSWTDYLYLTVGGTLSNAGISGQSFLYGPQINNVLQLDVITGKGDLITCSKDINSELFFAVLGGLGQFGIITRARIVLQKAPTRAKWVRLIYNDFEKFTRDQEHLISNDTKHGPNYVEGSLITDHSPPNNWRSSFYSPSDLSKLYSLLQSSNGLLYSLEVVKYYDHHNDDTIDQEVDLLVQDLNFIPGSVFKKDVALIEFLNRVGNSENKEKEAHPWLNLFIPKSRIMDFNAGVFVDIIIRTNRKTSGPILFYPFHRHKWDERMSAVIPEEEEIFYTLALLTTCGPSESEAFDKLNSQIIDFCEKSDIKIKQYLPSYNSKQEWKNHFGPKWPTFQERKLKFDPRMILSTGQRIFNSDLMESDKEY
ncbi:Cytokinin dehydrogenase [Castilleja foliolosa]|uniref:cytokinin dehydrogenase n=1 Tax=Castilleja foliolosa TaxID=1961234 RepID=A0ABD3C7R6_9LAMI